MRIIAEKVLCRDLKPGDLFSTADQLYWDHRDSQAVGEKVYIRTEALTPENQADEEIYKIIIKK